MEDKTTIPFKFIDVVNNVLGMQDISQSQLARATGIDKNSMGMYLRKDRKISFNAAIKIAKYLKLDISKIYDIKTDHNLTEIETKLLKEIRLAPEFLQVPTLLSLIDLVKIINMKK